MRRPGGRGIPVQVPGADTGGGVADALRQLARLARRPARRIRHPRLGGRTAHAVRRGLHHERHQPDRRHRRAGLGALLHRPVRPGPRLPVCPSTHIRPPGHLHVRRADPLLVLQRVRQREAGSQAVHGRRGQPDVRLRAELPGHPPERVGAGLPLGAEPLHGGRLLDGAGPAVRRGARGAAPPARAQEPVPAGQEPFPPQAVAHGHACADGDGDDPARLDVLHRPEPLAGLADERDAAGRHQYRMLVLAASDDQPVYPAEEAVGGKLVIRLYFYRQILNPKNTHNHGTERGKEGGVRGWNCPSRPFDGGRGIYGTLDGRRGGTYRAPEAGGCGDFPRRWRGGDFGGVAPALPLSDRGGAGLS